jgi:nodulation protein E
MPRVVITGAGCVTSIGSDITTFAENLFQGRQGITALQDVKSGEIRFSSAAQVVDFDAASQLPTAVLKMSERCSQFALVAAEQAVRNADFKQSGAAVATILGCSTGGRSIEEAETAKLYTTGARVHPLTVPRTMASCGTSLVALQHGFTGPAFTLSTACASGAHAIGLAFQMIRAGMVSAAITGGHEAPLTYGFLKAWDSLRVVSQSICRPFSADRDGMTLGEGAALFMLESMDSALERGAPILGEIIGFGMSCDAHHLTQPSATGPADAMRLAMQDASVQPHEVDYINAHGTGTTVNDAMEAEALHAVFGDCSHVPPISATKSMHGHAMGASGAIETLATLLALQRGLLPPTVGIIEADPDLHLDVITGQSRETNGRIALSNSFAFGGMNAVLAFRTYASAR